MSSAGEWSCISVILPLLVGIAEEVSTMEYWPRISATVGSNDRAREWPKLGSRPIRAEEYCRFIVSFLETLAPGDFDRALRVEGCKTSAVGLGPILRRYSSSAVGGLKMNPDTIIRIMHSKLYGYPR